MIFFSQKILKNIEAGRAVPGVRRGREAFEVLIANCKLQKNLDKKKLTSQTERAREQKQKQKQTENFNLDADFQLDGKTLPGSGWATG